MFAGGWFGVDVFGVLTRRVGHVLSLGAEIERQGYVFLPKFRPGERGAAVVQSIATVADFCRERPVHEIVVSRREQASPNTYSGRYGLDAFPWHTDFAHWSVPPRLLLLRCVVGFADVLTRLVDGSEVVKAVGESALFRALVRPRRPLKGALPLLRLLSRSSRASALIRWDEEYIRPASEAGRQGVSMFAQALAAQQGVSVCLSEPGDTLIVDNWRMLHGRTSVSALCVGRVLERSYLEAFR